MNSIKQIIHQNIVAPAAHTSGSIHTIAEVLQSDEKNNLCTVKCIDKNGILRNRDNVPVRLTGSSWFPAEGDKVIVEDFGKYINIVGKNDSGYAADTRSQNELKQDIYADSSSNSCGGWIF